MDMNNGWTYLIISLTLLIVAKPVSWFWESVRKNPKSYTNTLKLIGVVLAYIAAALGPMIIYILIPFNKNNVGLLVLMTVMAIILLMNQLKNDTEESLSKEIGKLTKRIKDLEDGFKQKD